MTTTIMVDTSTVAAQMPRWPALLQQSGADELLYIDSQQDWQQLWQSAAYLLNPGDRLIDSDGLTWILTPTVTQPLNILTPTSNISLDQLQKLVQRHALIEGNCCISKLQLISITDAMQFVKSLT
ncbi:DUF4144 family protein [Shewanella sp. A32]|uniref:DUF4144 family protein n=1 Tax=Shewanella sp. A32 TaxID=3031327 RepID=UPI0023B88694|nr:DUF4144 family protein [Shewanella sp. A32]MDF0535500.1 DUF4144 family protein [Shewanella sp. A32]